jgi:uncharacterized protein YndB with AHSA1/START domain
MSTAQPGDRATASVLVKVPPSEAFRIFTEEIDLWWRSGRKYRLGERGRSTIHLEPHLGGRLFESYEGDTGPVLVQSGTVRVWEPAERLVLEWRAVNFAPLEQTEVEVLFEPSPSGTLVTVHHRGWAILRGDHPVRHGADVPAFIRMMGMWWGDLLSSLREHALATQRVD